MFNRFENNYSLDSVIVLRHDPATATIITGLISAAAAGGTAVHTSKKNKKVAKRGREAALANVKRGEDLAQKEKEATGRLRAQEIEASRNRRVQEQARALGVEDQQLKGKGISSLGDTFRTQQQNVLDEGAVNG